MKNLLFLIIAVLVTSCNVKNLISENGYKAKGITLKGDKRITFIKYDATLKKSYTLSEPPPDAILEKATNLANSLSLKNETSKTDLSTEQKVELANKVISLGERTVAVNILRDALFRLSEMNLNNNNEKLEEGYKSLFDSILSASKEIALADKAKAEAQKVEAEVKKINALGIGDLESQAFEFLLKKDLENSKLSFKKSFEIFPSYHNVDEINKLLSNYTIDNITQEDWNYIFKTINEKYSWKLSKETKDKIKQLLK
jgi:hypothetical protein